MKKIDDSLAAVLPYGSFTPEGEIYLRGRGVTVNCIVPGPQKTPFFYNAETKETVAWLSSMRPSSASYSSSVSSTCGFSTCTES